MITKRLPTLLAALLVAGGVALAAAQDRGGAVAAASPKPAADNAAVIAQQLPSYPLDTCIVSGEKLGGMGDVVDHVVDGRLVRLCCKMCVKRVDADPAAAVAKIDAAVIRAQKPMWPKRLSTCPVSGEPFGDDTIDYVYGTRYVKLCCNGCTRAFAKDPAKYMAMVDKALIAELKASYPLTTCPLSGEELDDSAKDILYGVTLVRVCCARCEKAFQKNPAPVLAKLEAARKGATVKKGAAGAVGGAGGR